MLCGIVQATLDLKSYDPLGTITIGACYSVLFPPWEMGEFCNLNWDQCGPGLTVTIKSKAFTALLTMQQDHTVTALVRLGDSSNADVQVGCQLRDMSLWHSFIIWLFDIDIKAEIHAGLVQAVSDFAQSFSKQISSYEYFVDASHKVVVTGTLLHTTAVPSNHLTFYFSTKITAWDSTSHPADRLYL